ncbi:hypothetical protein J5Y03_11395 [Bacillus sp. RG28]|uniref:Uncharacterized protein n=1 Tax=Gottfriedia endophytica TaxID=2820819 RepID=A0A940SH39_9BACI|nr:hypothetical protein [Gottfriedia endophytica]MBP0725777.1 hypothetical protein [Gottfriedia endophytica]
MRLDMFITFILLGIYIGIFSEIVAEFFHYSNILMYGLSGMVIYGLIFLIITNIPRISGKTINWKLAFVVLMIDSVFFKMIGKYFELN